MFCFLSLVAKPIHCNKSPIRECLARLFYVCIKQGKVGHRQEKFGLCHSFVEELARQRLGTLRLLREQRRSRTAIAGGAVAYRYCRLSSESIGGSHDQSEC